MNFWPGNYQVNLQGGSRFAKIECKSQVKILNAKNWMRFSAGFVKSAKIECKIECKKLNGLISANLMSICQVVHLYYTSSVQMLTPCFQFECLSWVAYLRLPLPESRHSHVLANLKSYVLSAIVLFSKPH